MNEPTRTRADFLVLLALQTGPKHGYQIATWLEQRSGGYFTLSFGALYPVLHRLKKEGLLSAEWQAVGEAGLKRKKVYSLTARGRRGLESERARFEALSGAFARLLAAK
jgi:PadR family transcriptional regulator, regulatory protein PadR